MASAPSVTAVKTLFALSGNVCMYRGCEQPLTNPKWLQVRGRVAHIKGEKPGSARYDPAQPDAERQGFDNLMLLCPNCHNRIDDLEPDEHPVELLHEMREQHIARAHDRPGWQPTERQLNRFASQALTYDRPMLPSDDELIRDPTVSLQPVEMRMKVDAFGARVVRGVDDDGGADDGVDASPPHPSSSQGS